MIPAVLILLTLATMQAHPGDVLNITITDSAVLSVNDSCVYFPESMASTLNADAGTHEVKVGINCSAGVKEIKANGESLMLIDVQEAGSSYIVNYAAEMERQNLALQKEVKNLKLQLEKLGEKLNELKTRYEESERQKGLLEVENNLLKDQIKSLEDKLNRTQKELKEKKGTLSVLQTELQSMNEQSQIYRLATFFILSLFVGSYAALLYVSRKE